MKHVVALHCEDIFQIYVYTDIHTYTYVCISVCMDIHMHMDRYMCTYRYIHTNIHTHICCTYIYIYTHIHIYVYTCTVCDVYLDKYIVSLYYSIISYESADNIQEDAKHWEPRFDILENGSTSTLEGSSSCDIEEDSSIEFKDVSDREMRMRMMMMLEKHDNNDMEAMDLNLIRWRRFL